jgi:hypothetical protein
MRPQHRNSQRFKRGVERRIVAHGHRAHRIAVVGMVQRDDAVACAPLIAPVLHRQLHGDLDGRRPVVRVEDAREPPWQDPEQPLGEVNSRLVRGACEDDVLDPLRLVGQCLVQPRVRVSVDVHPPR